MEVLPTPLLVPATTTQGTPGPSCAAPLMALLPRAAARL